MTKRLMRLTRLPSSGSGLIRPRRLARLSLTGLVVLTAAAASGGATAFGQAPAVTPWRLASAQVVTSTVHPPMLKLSASGPIAFEVLPADASGAPVGPDRVVARLYGIAPGDLASSGDLAPFALTVTAEPSANGIDTDTLLTIATGAASGQRLILRAGMKSSELEAAFVPIM
jgi:hypothetical protein